MKVRHKGSQYNFELLLRDGDFINGTRKVIGVPYKLTPKQQEKYIPYLNIYDERGIVGTLDHTDLRYLKKWLQRVGL